MFCCMTKGVKGSMLHVAVGDFDRNRKKKNELYFISLSGK